MDHCSKLYRSELYGRLLTYVSNIKNQLKLEAIVQTVSAFDTVYVLLVLCMYVQMFDFYRKQIPESMQLKPFEAYVKNILKLNKRWRNIRQITGVGDFKL